MRVQGLLRLLPCFFAVLLVALASAQEPLATAEPANVAGNWTISSKNWNGTVDTKYIQLQQKGSEITGHFKGPYQSGGLEGTVNGRHIVFHTKTRTVLNFGGQVTGDTMEGNFHVRGKEGQWHAVRTGP